MAQFRSKRDLPRLFSDAYQWLCRSRKNHPPSSDIWNSRHCWNKQADKIMNLFWKGHYRFDVQEKLTLSYGETIAVWGSCDALILKVLTRIIQDNLKPFLSKSCYHLKGHGGLKGAIRDVMKHCPKYKFFCKTDVKSYYDSIDHYSLLMKLHNCIHDSKIIGYVWQFLNRCVESGGLYRDVRKGIPRGSSLSPLLGAFYLLDLDRKLKKMDVKYYRYMDDILILAQTRWKLKKAIRVLNQTFNELTLEKHPDKTLIGRTERGFGFLGYFHRPGQLAVSDETVKRFSKRIARLYEHGADAVRIGQYVLKWMQWVRAGMEGVTTGHIPHRLREEQVIIYILYTQNL